MFGSGGLEKGLCFGRNPRINFSGNYLVDGISDRCTNVFSARQVVMHSDHFGKPPDLGLILMMRGRLVIASAISGLVEVVRTVGIVCPTDDVEPLAACMSAVIAHPERIAALGSQARECVLSMFGYTRMLEVHAQVYRRAASKRGV